MFYILFAIIPTIIFYKIVDTKQIYRIMLTLLFWVFVVVFCGISSNMIFNLYCTLTDNIGYNKITDFVHYISTISGYIFLILSTLILFIIYKKRSKFLFRYLILVVLLITNLFIFKFISYTIYFNLVDNLSYNNFYIKIYRIFEIFLTFVILIGGIFYGIKKVTQK